MQLPLFQETHEPDSEALSRCLRAEVIALDIETQTRWQGTARHRTEGRFWLELFG